MVLGNIKQYFVIIPEDFYITVREDSNHYLLLCPLYFQGRITMLNKIRHLTRTHISCDLLLYGAQELDLVTNYKVFDAAHEFISSTDRL